MRKHLIKWLTEIIEKKEKGVQNMLASRRRCLDYSEVFNEVRERLLLGWNQNKNYILRIFYTNSKFNIDLPYSSTDLLPANKHN